MSSHTHAITSQTKQNQNTPKDKAPTNRFKELVKVNSLYPQQDTPKKQTVFDLSRSHRREKSPPKKRKQKPQDPPTNLPQTSTFLSADRVAISKTSAISTSSALLDVLADEMIRYVKLEEKKGIVTTEVILANQDPLLNGTQIVIEHYDTAPHSFNLRLKGVNAQAYDLFCQNEALLNERLTNRLDQFVIHINIEHLPLENSEKKSLRVQPSQPFTKKETKKSLPKLKKIH